MTALGEINKYWEEMPEGKTYLRYELAVNSTEFKEVAAPFKADTGKDPIKVL